MSNENNNNEKKTFKRKSRQGLSPEERQDLVDRGLVRRSGRIRTSTKKENIEDDDNSYSMAKLAYKKIEPLPWKLTKKQKIASKCLEMSGARFDECENVPWLEGASTTGAGVERSTGDKHFSPSSWKDLPSHILEELTFELKCFQRYVSLSTPEHLLKRHVIEQVKQACQQKEGKGKIEATSYGSFESVDIFGNDLNLVLWGIVGDPRDENSRLGGKVVITPLRSMNSKVHGNRGKKTKKKDANGKVDDRRLGPIDSQVHDNRGQ
jgi:hypothetical protein